LNDTGRLGNCSVSRKELGPVNQGVQMKGFAHGVQHVALCGRGRQRRMGNGEARHIHGIEGRPRGYFEETAKSLLSGDLPATVGGMLGRNGWSQPGDGESSTNLGHEISRIGVPMMAGGMLGW
jgi:hypothetical protein